MRRAILAIGIVFFAACVIACGGAGKPAARASFADKDLQKSREKMVQGLIDKGIFKSVTLDDETTVTVVVGPAFNRLDFSDKQLFVGAAAAWMFRVPKGDSLTESEFVHIQDSKTNKVIGSFSKSHGLTLD